MKLTSALRHTRVWSRRVRERSKAWGEERERGGGCEELLPNENAQQI
jgi:hypothetical protein